MKPIEVSLLRILSSSKLILFLGGNRRNGAKSDRPSSSLRNESTRHETATTSSSGSRHGHGKHRKIILPKSERQTGQCWPVGIRKRLCRGGTRAESPARRCRTTQSYLRVRELCLTLPYLFFSLQGIYSSLRTGFGVEWETDIARSSRISAIASKGLSRNDRSTYKDAWN